MYCKNLATEISLPRKLYRMILYCVHYGSLNIVYAEEEVKERAKRAAAASRRWREYSRKGVDKPSTFKLPEAMSNKEK